MTILLFQGWKEGYSECAMGKLTYFYYLSPKHYCIISIVSFKSTLPTCYIIMIYLLPTILYILLPSCTQGDQHVHNIPCVIIWYQPIRERVEMLFKRCCQIGIPIELIIRNLLVHSSSSHVKFRMTRLSVH